MTELKQPFEFDHLPDQQPAPSWDSTPNTLATSKEIFVGAAKGQTHIDPRRGIGIATSAEDNSLMTAKGQYYSVAYANGSTTATPTIDWANGNVQTAAITQNTTFSFANGKAGGRYMFRVLQDESGSRSYTWPAAVRWPGGSAPSASAGGKIDVLSFVYDGLIYFAASSLSY